MPDEDLFKPNVDCYYRNETGTDYTGRHNFAEKGVACVPWNMLNPRNKFHPGQSKMKNKDLRENFCRNPGKPCQTFITYSLTFFNFQIMIQKDHGALFQSGKEANQEANPDINIAKFLTVKH